MQTLPLVALVGRPNVGKSTLYNRLIEKRQAVISDISGTTRDRLETAIEWQGKSFLVADMAGLELTLEGDTEIQKAAQTQVRRVLQDAALIVWITDGTEGPTPADQTVAKVLRTLGKPVILVVNKCDNAAKKAQKYEFAQFGFEPLLSVSAIHGLGIEELKDQIQRLLPDTSTILKPTNQSEIRIAITGRPNVGKSTLLNAILGEERSVVSKVAGTTRDSVDTVIPATQFFQKTASSWQSVRLIDTAGIRRPGKREPGIEKWSVMRALEAINQAEVVLFLIEATEGLTHQDLQVAEQAVEAGKGMILLVNKWDLILKEKNLVLGSEEESKEQEKFLNITRRQAPFLHWIPVLFLSAEQKINLKYLGRIVQRVHQAWSRQISQEELNELTLSLRGHPRLKNLKKIVFEHSAPPVFHLHLEGKRLPHFSTNRFVENTLREHFELGPTPIKIWSLTSVPRS